MSKENMKNIIRFTVSGGMDGYYVASGENAPIVTQGKTWEDLIANIQEATELYLETMNDLNKQVPKRPFLKLSYGIPLVAHAKA